MRRVMTFSFKVSLFSFNRLSSKIQNLDSSRSERIVQLPLSFVICVCWPTLCKPCNRICRGNIHADTMSTRVIYNGVTDNPSVWCGHFRAIPRASINCNAFIFVTDKSSVWHGSFWPIPRSPIKRNSILFMYPCAVLLSHSLRRIPYWRARSYDCLGTHRLR